MIRSIDQAKAVKFFIIGTFVTLYLLVSIISTIHVIDFFRMSNPDWLAISLAIAFEVGAAASLASIIALNKMNKGIVWMLFIILTLMQAMGNTYYAYTHLQDFQGWIELFGLNEEEPIFQKRILSLVSGAILPIVALGFIKSLVDYIKPENEADTLHEEIMKTDIEALDEKLPKEAPVEEPIAEKKTEQESVEVTSDVDPLPVDQPRFELFKMDPVPVEKPKRAKKSTKPVEEVKAEPQIDNLKSEAQGGKRPNPDEILAKNGRF